MPGTRPAKAVEELIDAFLMRNADGVVAVSDPMSAYYAGFGRAVDTIRNGYDPERIATAQALAQWHQRVLHASVVVH